MTDALPEATRQVVELAGPAPDATQRAMQDRAASDAFPIIGPAAGGLLSVVARLTGAERVLELGSGFGYSASWFARGMGPDGEVRLTERHADEIELARSFLEEGDYAPWFRYSVGDGIEIAREETGPLDVVLLDLEKGRYAEAFETVRDRVVSGGVVVADNVLQGPHDVDDVLARLGAASGPEPDVDGGSTDESAGTASTPEATDAGTAAGIARFLARLRRDPAFETVVLPTGSGLSLSVRRR